MKIAMIGTGYVGLVSGTCFAEFGVNVTCVDLDINKIQRLEDGKIPIFEPGLEELVAKQVKAKRLSFTTDIKEAVKDADAVFIAVGTPSRRSDGHADLKYVYQAAKDIINAAEGYTVIVTKSTVPVGTAKEIKRIIREEKPDGEFDVCSNPEFLREGAAIDDFLRPDRVVIGADSERAREVMRELYRPLFLNETPIVFTSPETSEITKYAANAFLATKISFINEIANLCEAAGGNVQDVARAMGLDKRIGSKFLNAGPGYGGSCFPKDTLALAQTGQKYGVPQQITEAVIKVNKERQEDMAQRVIELCGGDVNSKRIGILGVAFKPNTDDVRDSPSLVIIPELQKAGASISVYDPEAREQAEQHLKNVDWKEEPYAVAEDADALVIVTEWNEFRALDLKKIAPTMKAKRIADFRNIYNRDTVKALGYEYTSIGRGSDSKTDASSQSKAA